MRIKRSPAARRHRRHSLATAGGALLLPATMPKRHGLRREVFSSKLRMLRAYWGRSAAMTPTTSFRAQYGDSTEGQAPALSCVRLGLEAKFFSPNGVTADLNKRSRRPARRHRGCTGPSSAIGSGHWTVVTGDYERVLNSTTIPTVSKPHQRWYTSNSRQGQQYSAKTGIPAGGRRKRGWLPGLQELSRTWPTPT